MCSGAGGAGGREIGAERRPGPEGGGRAGVQMQVCWLATLWPALWLLYLSAPLLPRQTPLRENDNPLFKHCTPFFGLGNMGGGGIGRLEDHVCLGGKRNVYDTRNVGRRADLGLRHRGRVQWAESKSCPPDWPWVAWEGLEETWW